MKVQLFDITFDDAALNPHAVYRSGQLVSFRVHLVLLQAVKCRAIYVKPFGNAYVHWSESKSTNNGSETRHFTSNEVYMDEKVIIYSPEMSGPNAEHHPPGEFYYRGSFQIPHEAPSSYEGDVGRIRYYVKANIDRPWMIDNYTEKFFTVIRDLDLNFRPVELVGPFSTEGDFDVNCCHCFNCCFGKAQVTMSLPKKGYVPGEQVHVTGEILNTSSTDLYSVNLEIYQKSIFHADGHTKDICRVVSSVEAPGVPRGGTLQLNYLIPVNPVPNSHIEGCTNIEVFYYFRINADGGFCVSMSRECCELLIGTIPLWSSYGYPYGLAIPPVPQQGVLPPPMQGACDGPMMGPVSSQPQTQQLPPPPTYEECMFGRVDMEKGEGENINGTTQWAPRYPVYALASAPPPMPQQQPFPDAPGKQ